MSLVWHFYWPVLLAAAVVGILAGRVAFRQRRLSDDSSKERVEEARREYLVRKRKYVTLGLATVLAIMALWHWPLGAAGRFASAVEIAAAEELRRVDSPEFSATLVRAPLGRTLIVSGSANDFQKDGFVRLLREIPGVSGVRWAGAPRGFGLPLFVEALLLCLAGYAAGLFFSWIVEIRRRVNAHWNW